MHKRRPSTEPRRRLTHVFFDAEGTLWVPRPGRSFAEFWDDPDPARAVEIFEPTPHLAETLDALQRRGLRLVVVSLHDVHVLPRLLQGFGIADRFDDVLVNGHKGARILQWLADHGLGPENAVMVGDRPDLDIDPVEAFGVPAVLLDREYNRDADAVRIHDLRDLVGLLAFAGRIVEPVDPAHAMATEAGTWTGLAPAHG